MKQESSHPDIARFGRLRAAVADSSSLIAMRKAGFLDILMAEISLETIPEVIEETGFKELPLTLPEDEEYSSLAPAEQKRRVDRLLVGYAAKRRLPVLSEDRKVLLEADGLGLDYFNALMMLNFLLSRNAVSPEEHSHFFSLLLTNARYGKEILAYSREVYQEVMKLR